jgi:putative transposase
MAQFSLQINAYFDWDKVGYRITRIHEDKQVVLECIKDGKTVLCTTDDLLQAYAEGRLSGASSVKADIVPVCSRPLSDLPKFQQDEIDRRRAYLKAISDSDYVVFTKKCLAPLIAAVAQTLGDKKPPSTTSLWRWNSRFRAFNDARSLVPMFNLRGSREPIQNARFMEILTCAVQDAFKASPKATVGGIYDRVVGKIKAENTSRLPADLLKIPSKRTVYRLLGRTEAYDQFILRNGQAAGDRRFRITKAGAKTSTILERVEADHTPLDLFLIDEKTWLPLGRPTLTIYIDHFSRFPLGYYLSYGGTSATAVIGALRHAILPKIPVRPVIPNLDVNHHWPCYGVMDVLVLDNGMEFLGKDLESVAFDLDIRLQFCPKRTPRFKGTVERYLKTVNYFFAHQIPGTSMAKLADRGDYDPQKHAVLTLSEFQHVFEKWLLDVYAQTIHRGIGTTPWAKWEEGAKSRTIELPPDIETLKQRIGLVRERSLRHDGIIFEGIRYADDNLLPLIKKWGIGVKVRMVFDPEDLSSIQVWGPQNPDAVSVLAIDQEYTKRLTLIQHQLIRQQVRDNGKNVENASDVAAAKYQIALALEEMISSRKQKTRRKSAKVHGITSENPEARLDVSAPIILPKLARSSLKPAENITNEIPPDRLPTFVLKPSEDA